MLLQKVDHASQTRPRQSDGHLQNRLNYRVLVKGRPLEGGHLLRYLEGKEGRLAILEVLARGVGHDQLVEAEDRGR